METLAEHYGMHNGSNSNNNRIYTQDRRDIGRLKSSLTLDISGSRTAGNGIDLCALSGHLEDGVLSTPDVGLLKLATPELERLVLQQFLQQQQQELTGVICPEQRQVQLEHRGLVNVPMANTEVQPLNSGNVTVSQAIGGGPTFMAYAMPSQTNVQSVVQLMQPVQDYQYRGARVIAAATASGVGMGSADYLTSTVPAATSADVIDMSAKTSHQDMHDIRNMHLQSTPRTISDLTNYAPSANLQFSSSPLSVYTSGATPTPPPSTSISSKSARRLASSFVDGDRIHMSTPSSSVGDDVTYGGDWCPSKRKCRRMVDSAENDSLMSVEAAACVETPPISPIDMAEQELIKMERKRARNRLAAMRCRNRKLERISTLQDQADRLRANNAQLAAEVSQLRETVYQLRRDMSRHTAAGCQLQYTLSMPPGSYQGHQRQQQQPYLLSSSVGSSGR